MWFLCLKVTSLSYVNWEARFLFSRFYHVIPAISRNWSWSRSIITVVFWPAIATVVKEGYLTEWLIWRRINISSSVLLKPAPLRDLSIRHNSYFEKSKLSIFQILQLTYYWVNKLSSKYIATQLEFGSPNTIVDWRNYSREVCVVILERDNVVLGGEF